MTKHSRNLEPTNVERAEWARNALATFTAETYSGDHPSTMHTDDLGSAIGDLICDLLHFAYFHPRLDALAIHAHARSMFQLELTGEQMADHSAGPTVRLLDALLNIKRLAGKSGDQEVDPFTLLDLISDEVQNVLAKTTPKRK